MILVLIVSVSRVDNSCIQTTKYYVGCSARRTVNESVRFCAQHGMVLVNLTNSSTLSADVALLNGTLNADGCLENFWFASGNVTGYVANVATLGNVLGNLLGGVLNLVGNLIGGLGCLFGLCPPTTTTPPPITSAMTVCARLAQRRVIQKCSTQSHRLDMPTFQFTQQTMYAGLLDTFESRSQTSCSALCSSDDACVGIAYGNDTCTLFL